MFDVPVQELYRGSLSAVDHDARGPTAPRGTLMRPEAPEAEALRILAEAEHVISS
jgi:hypothetical protein